MSTETQLEDTEVFCPSWHSTILAQGWNPPGGRSYHPKQLTGLDCGEKVIEPHKIAIGYSIS